MAVLNGNGEKVDVEDNSPCQAPAEKLGLPFGCATGICGTCLVEVESGMENLTEKTKEEEDMELESHERLLCQCKIKKGEVKIKF